MSSPVSNEINLILGWLDRNSISDPNPKPKVQGVFPLKLRIDYLDENGKYKAHEPEPVTITVKELGVKGWLKGEK